MPPVGFEPKISAGERPQAAKAKAKDALLILSTRYAVSGIRFAMCILHFTLSVISGRHLVRGSPADILSSRRVSLTHGE